MQRRFVSIWFPHLHTDWFSLRRQELHKQAFVLTEPYRGKMIVAHANALAQAAGIYSGTALADARANYPSLIAINNKPDLAPKLLKRLAEWCIRFTPYVSVDLPGGLLLDVSGCSHLWGGDENYLQEITRRLNERGYTVRAAMADTIGAAWALARYGKESFVIKKGEQVAVIANLPPEALRIDIETIERLHKLGLKQIKDFFSFPKYSLRRRFGALFMQRLHQALGIEEETIQPLYPVVSYSERLPALEPIATRTGIEIALKRLLETLCNRLRKEGKGLRSACFACYRVDGAIIRVDVSTNSASHNEEHLFKLFEIKLDTIQPDLGIELFVLEALKVEDALPEQEKIWREPGDTKDADLSKLLDRLASKFGNACIHRYLPSENYLPEKSFVKATSLQEKKKSEWKLERPRPIILLSPPEPIQVTAPVPDYPPMNFRYKGKLHIIAKADGPERIEQPWWIKKGRHRDYYYVEDEEGKRFWLFRSGHYTEERKEKWFVHGFFV